MQDYGRALIVGEPTFGKGTVQQYRSLNRIYDQMLRPEWPALGSVQYTIQKFYRVNGGSTQRKGVTPDILMPTGVDPAETGEAFEDNAMPWDSINAATYSKTGDMVPFEPELLKDHQQRIAQNPEFQYIAQDIAHYKALKDKRNIVSLNLAVREKENHDDDATRLKRINERTERAGKKPLKSLDDLPKDYQEPDPYLDETVHIALDWLIWKKNSPLSSQRRPNKAASGRMKNAPSGAFFMAALRAAQTAFLRWRSPSRMQETTTSRQPISDSNSGTSCQNSQPRAILKTMPI